MHRDEIIRLRHMLDAARAAILSARGRTRPDLDRDPVWALGIVKCVEIVGEAAARVSEGTREKHNGIPWAQIVAMRNRLVHAYFDIDMDQVWKAVTEDLPTLINMLEPLIPTGEPN